MSENNLPGEPPKEAPKEGFDVEVRQPELLYLLAQQIVDGQAETFTEISNTSLNDPILESERTVLNGFEIGWGKKHVGYPSKEEGTFHFSTNLRLSEIYQAGNDHGYFSYEKVEEINRKLVEKGIRSTAETNVFGEGKSRIKIEQNGSFYELFFGFPSRQAEEIYINSKAEEERKDDRVGYYRRFEQPKIASGLTNDSISLGLVNEDRYETGFEGYPKLENMSEFVSAAETYVKVYKDVVTAIYEIEGQSPPDKSVIIRPPIKSDDALTELSSTSTETPITITEKQLQAETVGFEDIAGQDYAVSEAKRLVLAINHPEVFEKRGVKRPKGILLYGPPGTGKTLIAKAVANEANAVFLEVSTADIGTKWYGESEKLMQGVFNIANDQVAAGKKVVLFFDEIDSLAPSRDNAHEATKKVVGILLRNMDGMKANPNVTVLAATNRPQDIDEALKRPGRFDKLIPVLNPDADGRVAVLKVHIDKAIKAAQDPSNMFSVDINLDELGRATEGMSPADLANLVNLTLEDKTMEELQGKEWTPVTTEQMLRTAKRLGLLKEEKRRIGFVQPGQNGGSK